MADTPYYGAATSFGSIKRASVSVEYKDITQTPYVRLIIYETLILCFC